MTDFIAVVDQAVAAGLVIPTHKPILLDKLSMFTKDVTALGGSPAAGLAELTAELQQFIKLHAEANEHAKANGGARPANAPASKDVGTKLVRVMEKHYRTVKAAIEAAAKQKADAAPAVVAPLSTPAAAAAAAAAAHTVAGLPSASAAAALAAAKPRSAAGLGAGVGQSPIPSVLEAVGAMPTFSAKLEAAVAETFPDKQGDPFFSPSFDPISYINEKVSLVIGLQRWAARCSPSNRPPFLSPHPHPSLPASPPPPPPSVPRREVA